MKCFYNSIILPFRLTFRITFFKINIFFRPKNLNFECLEICEIFSSRVRKSVVFYFKMNVPGKMCLIMSKDKSMVFMLRMSSTYQDINIHVQEDQGKEESDESDAHDVAAEVGPPWG